MYCFLSATNSFKAALLTQVVRRRYTHGPFLDMVNRDLHSLQSRTPPAIARRRHAQESHGDVPVADISGPHTLSTGVMLRKIVHRVVLLTDVQEQIGNDSLDVGDHRPGHRFGDTPDSHECFTMLS